MRKNLLLTVISLATLIGFASCLSDGEDDKTSAYGYCTITGSKSSGYTLYQDGGVKITPTLSSVNDLTEGKGMDDVERALFVYQYRNSDYNAQTNTITGAELQSGESYNPLNPIARQEAESQNILSNDSLFDVSRISAIWAYRGYLTIIYTAYYGWNEKKDGYLYPTASLVYNTDEPVANELNLTLCHNERRSKDTNPAAYMSFTTCFRLNSLQSVVAGSDSVKLNLSARGVDNVSFKISRQDFTTGNY